MLNRNNIFKLISIFVALGVVVFMIFTVFKKENTEYYINSSGEKVMLCSKFSLLDITNICYDTKDFSVITEYVSISGLPEGNNTVRWEVGKGQELSNIDSNKGKVDYDYIDDVAYIEIQEGCKDIQLVLYIKTNNLSKSLNSIINMNKDYYIANNFGYTVILPDGTLEELPRRLCEDDKITLKDYFVWLKGL